jgi:hypothetical protein
MKRSAVALALLLSACGGGSSSPTTPSTPAPRPNTVGPAGGTVVAENGAARLVVPPGALSTTVTFSLQRAAPASLPSDPRFVPDTAWVVSPNTPFTTPATLVLRYDPARVPAGIDESELRVYGVGPGVWAPVGQSTVDVAADEASGPITRTATFGVRALD